jgi:hypothetical protein
MSAGSTATGQGKLTIIRFFQILVKDCVVFDNMLGCRGADGSPVGMKKF